MNDTETVASSDVLGSRVCRDVKMDTRRLSPPVQLARRMFRYSITYLFLMFAALLVDHYCRVG
jgi:heme O synthase-like polyprenyltransferase